MADMTAKEREYIDKEVTRNCEAFEKQLPSLPGRHRGKHALMHDQKIIGMFSTVQDAVQAGEIMYKDGIYSVQEVTDEVVDLGFLSHAVHTR